MKEALLYSTDSFNFLNISDTKCFLKYYKSIFKLFEMSSHDKSILGFEGDFDDDKTERLRSYFCSQIDFSCMNILIAVDNDNNVVFCCVMKNSAQETTRHIIDLQKGFVHPDLRGSRLLKMALFNVASIAKQKSADLLTLDVRHGSPAFKIWSHVGFKTFGVLDDYARHQGKSYQGHYMSIPTERLFNKFNPYSQPNGEIKNVT